MIQSLIQRMRQVSPMVLLIVVAGLRCPSAAAESSPLRFTFLDGSVVHGRLAGSDRPQHVRLVNDLFSQPMEVPLAMVLDAVVPHADDDQTRGDQADATFRSLALLLTDRTRLIGQIQSWDDNTCVVETRDLGRVEFDPQRLVSVTAADLVPQQILALAHTATRWQTGAGWTFVDGQLVADRGAAITVGELQLPDRFHLHLQIESEGLVDLEWSLTDLRRGRAGQGGPDGRVDRRGGSLSRLPSERFVTRMEWFGQDLSIVRSNASVSDSAVFRSLRPSGVLDVDLYCDQTNGVLSAYESGQLQGRVGLRDDMPIKRRSILLENRGDPVVVKRLDLMRWDGIDPVSRRLPERFSLLRDETLLGGVADQWRDGQFLIAGHSLPDGQAIDQQQLLRMEYGRQTTPELNDTCELTLQDGCRVVGKLVGQSASGALLVQGHANVRYEVESSRIRRLVAAGDVAGVGDEDDPVAAAELIADGIQLRGRLVNSPAEAVPFAWRPNVATNPLPIVAQQGVRVEFARVSAGGQAEAELIPSVQLIDGDVVPGELAAIDREGVKLIQTWAGPVTVPTQQVVGVRLQRSASAGQTSLESVLTVPRRLKNQPPTHVLVSPAGDLLRGQLVSMDRTRARIEVREITRQIAREDIARIVWIDQTGQRTPASRFAVQTRQGARVGFQLASIDGDQFQGDSEVLGHCVVPMQSIQTLHFGDRPWPVAAAWQSIPALEPKTFED
ncbi:hypothetical protein NHH03_00255 [Stieleria sp. TO1_6]|uniref:hypothetical protein n=1 Tax=Stieleria tagensis TaxID=2956795 RepID=UPI00209B4803|nr:hypothetical protein [Stieleria tagensis]MCO8120151.1 hypothetical protein [Stieleria tagensis]